MSAPAGGVYIDLTGYRIAADRQGHYIVFIIKIRLGQFAWTVYRRFTAFKALGDLLRAKIPDCPPCPPKRLLGAHSPEFLEQRRMELLAWVRQLAKVELVCRSPEFHEFLRDQHAHRRLGFSGEEIEGFMQDAGLESVERRDLAPLVRQGDQLTVSFWVGRDPRVIADDIDMTHREIA